MGEISKQTVIDGSEDALLRAALVVATTRDPRDSAQALKDGTQIRYFLKALQNAETEDEDVTRILFALNKLSKVYNQQSISLISV